MQIFSTRSPYVRIGGDGEGKERQLSRKNIFLGSLYKGSYTNHVATNRRGRGGVPQETITQHNSY